MTKIYLIRHAQSVGNIEKRLTGRSNYEITQEGKEQIKKLTNSLKKIPFDVAYASPSKRAIETIRPLCLLNNIPIIEEEQLYEMYFGIYDGWMWEEVNNVDETIHQMHIQTNEIMGIPKQESTKQVTNRMYNVILNIARKHKGKNILIASHGVAIEAFLRKITGEEFSKKREKYSQKNTAVNQILFNEKEEFQVIQINNLQHLKTK